MSALIQKWQWLPQWYLWRLLISSRAERSKEQTLLRFVSLNSGLDIRYPRATLNGFLLKQRDNFDRSFHFHCSLFSDGKSTSALANLLYLMDVTFKMLSLILVLICLVLTSRHWMLS